METDKHIIKLRTEETEIYSTRILLQRVMTQKLAPWIEVLPEPTLTELLEFIYQTEFLPRGDEALLDAIGFELKLPRIPVGLSDAGRKAAYDDRHQEISKLLAKDAAAEILAERKSAEEGEHNV